MNTTTNQFYRSFKYLSFVLILSIPLLSWSQETEEQDSTKTGYSFGNIKMPNPNSILSKYTYDPLSDRYIYTESVGNFNINYPLILTPKEYDRLVQKENIKSYYKQMIDAYDGKKEGAEEEQKNLLPEFYVNSGFFESIFGGNTIELIPQGSVEIDLGILFSRQDNPAFSPRNRSNFTFDFDQRISLSLLGKIGERVQVTANYDTQSTFDFQNLIKIEYTPTEDDIIQKIEIGNVNMPLNSSLITGAQSLFGVKTQLQFGKTTITGVFSEQKSEQRTVIAEGGGTLEEFDLFIRDYDENRHFFLAQYFRDSYDRSLQTYPFLNTNVQITRIEVWVTNRSNRTDNVRNIVALQDLGETDKVYSGVTVTGAPGAYPDNTNNAYDPTNIGGPGSQITELIRDVATVQNGILVSGVNEGYDYGKLENARKLIEGQEYVLNSQLGYISLNQRLNNDEILAVAYQYTVGGQVYQIGEFANDGVNATNVDIDNTTGQVTAVNNQNLILKMLKSSITSVELPIWDLMMKNIYDTGAYQLSQEDFKLNIFYTESSPVNYITPVEGTTFPSFNGEAIQDTPLLRLFHLDRLNFNNDPQQGGDGFFDFVPGITVIPQNGKVIFTKVEPFGEYLFDVLSEGGEDYENTATFNPNQEKYVYDILYKSTKTAALNEIEKNKFQLKGRYKSEGGDGIPIGAFNVPRGSVTVTAGGRVLVEGVDYVVNYQLGRVQILDEALKASNTPIQISTENNALFGQITKRFMGVNVEHRFTDSFIMNATLLNLSERPITQKANFNSEPVNNTIFGLGLNYSTEVPFFTRMVNKLPNIDTDVPSNLAVRGEVAVLKPGAPKGINFNGEATAYIDDFEGTQNAIEMKTPQSWFLSSRPLELGRTYPQGGEDENGYQNGFDRALLNWYTIDPIFYGSQKPDGVSDDDISDLNTSRIFINELFPDQDIAQGQTTVLYSLDLAYYPEERGPYNFDPNGVQNDGITLTNPEDSWAGITRQLTSTDFEQANVEYIEFWIQDPFLNDPNNTGGKLVFNLGNVSEDVIKDGRKLYENGLPQDGDVSILRKTNWYPDPSNVNPNGLGTAVPQNQALIYAFDTTGQERTNQDVGYDGYDDIEEAAMVAGTPFANLSDPSNDNYAYYLNTEGDIFERYKLYNGTQGNSLEAFTDTNRAGTTQPDVEDINRDNTMNTIDSYFEYELEINRNNLPLNSLDEITPSNPIGEFIRDIKIRPRNLPNGSTEDVRWYQFRIPVNVPMTVFDDDVNYPQYRRYGGISDFRSIRFVRMFLKDFSKKTVFRFGTLELVRSDWRRYLLSLQDPAIDPDPTDDNTEFTVGVISLLQNDGNYELPPGVELEELFNNNTVIRQNEQSLVVNVCNLETEDSRGVFKNISVDMRQYKKLRMFIHAEEGTVTGLDDDELVGFVRFGNDISQNYYQIEVPLKVTGAGTNEVWPEQNEINLPLKILQEIKALSITGGSISEDALFYDVINGQLNPTPVAEFAPLPPDGSFDRFHRVAIKGNPNFGDVRTLMVGVKNRSNNDACGEVWFNELRMSDMDSEGGWAGVLSVDTNIADFANISATGRKSTAGFGGIEQGPNERSREDVKQYDFVTNVNIGQLLPQKWGLQIPFNYGQGVEVITPQFDQFYRDIELETILDNATQSQQDSILRVNESYTRRQSINFIGVRKTKTNEEKPKVYDVENLTLNYSYNKVEHRDFEIENSVDKNVRLGANYTYNFEPKVVEPFKKNDSIFKSDYWKLLKEFNLNLLPSNFNMSADINRRFSRQKFRDIDLGGNNIGLEELYRRNYTFDFQYGFNYQLTRSLQLNFTASNNNIVRNYFINDQIIDGEPDPTLDVWDGLLDVGDPNLQYQQLGLNYEIPINKIPTFNFINATYSYTGTFQWQKGSDSFKEVTYTDGLTYDLGNTIQNSNTHNLNTTLDMNRLYSYLGIGKRNSRNSRGGRTNNSRDKSDSGPQPKKKSDGAGTKILNAGLDILTSVKRVQVNYSENNGSMLPGYLLSPGFIGTLKPTLGYTFGSQSDVRELAARKGWLTLYPEFNQQYTSTKYKQLDFSANLEPLRDLKIDLLGNRIYAENYTENYIINDFDNDGVLDYNSLTPNTFGNFSISTIMLKTSFSKSDENSSQAFNEFRQNRLTISRRLAEQNGVDMTNPDNFENGDVNGYPLGYSKSSQAVLLPAFLAAYTGKDANSVKLGAFRDFPVPNWDIKYTGLMNIKWFKDRFKRFSLTHGYRSNYTINQYRSNLDYQPPNRDTDGSLGDYNTQPSNALNQAGDYKAKTLYSNINLTEMFSPLIRIDMEMKNSIKILAEIRRDRMLSLSFDNNLMTEILGKEYTLGLGYRFKDVRIRSKLAGPRNVVVSDLNMKADVSIRDNKTIIRYLDLDNNQITSGQTVWNIKYSADYAFSKNFTGIFYFDYTFSEYAISTAFPQTTIRSGITLRYNFGN